MNDNYGERPSWDEWAFELARVASTRSTCPRVASDCVIMSTVTHRVVGIGYNGAPSGENHCTDIGCLIMANHCIRSVHAEINATALLGGGTPTPDYTNLIAYVYGPREICSHCARELYRVGVRDVRIRIWFGPSLIPGNQHPLTQLGLKHGQP